MALFPSYIILLSKHTMDKLTSLNLSFDRILIQIIVPGLTAIFPYFLLFLNHHPKAKDYFYNNQSVTITAITLISLIAGMLLENFGGRFEVCYLDWRIQKRNSDFDVIWNKYLSISYKDEPIGQRYLRNILLRLKFEISMGIAMIPMMKGLLILNYQLHIFESFYLTLLLMVLMPVTISIYLLFYEARSSSLILDKTRRLLVENFNNQSA